MYDKGGIQMNILVADEVWIGTALLHRENRERSDFSTNEIVDRIAKENIYESLRPGVIVHVNQHCIANRRPNPGNYRMLYETTRGRRRLFKPRDYYHPYREGGKIHPDPNKIPDKYRFLINWYEEKYSR
jgi:hypothetical protein